jgi:UDP-2,3-diacylglucosamine hydrolase
MRKVGIIAGQGDFPLLIARAARGAGVSVLVLGIKGFASEDLENCADTVCWMELGQLERAIELLKQHGVDSLVLAGRVPHTSIFQYRHFDRRAMKVLGRTLSRKADALLGALVDEFEREGIHVIDSSLFLKSLMPEPGLITARRPLTQRESEDVEFGFPIAKIIAGQDIGQTIVVREKMVVAVEGAEGTDECILRAGKLAGVGCVVIKVSKPHQDLRFDIPVIGRGTVESMVQAGCCALAVSARESFLFDREAVVAAAEEANIGIIAV